MAIRAIEFIESHRISMKTPNPASMNIAPKQPSSRVNADNFGTEAASLAESSARTSEALSSCSPAISAIRRSASSFAVMLRYKPSGVTTQPRNRAESQLNFSIRGTVTTAPFLLTANRLA